MILGEVCGLQHAGRDVGVVMGWAEKTLETRHDRAVGGGCWACMRCGHWCEFRDFSLSKL